MFRDWILFGVVAGACSAASWCAAAEALPTSEEIHKTYQDGKYQETLKDIAHVLSIHGQTAKQYDHYDLLIMKAESLMHIKSSAGAAQAFAEAAKLAPDHNAKAVDEATDLLIRKSTGMIYHPREDQKPGKKLIDDASKTESSAGIEIIEPDKRKEAMNLLYDNETSAIGPKVKEAMEGKSLAPILTVVKGCTELHVLELAAKGTEDDTKDLVSKLAEHARNLMKEAIQTMDDDVDSIKKSADEEVHYNIPVPDGGKGKYHMEDHVRRRGLDGKQTKNLNGYIADAKKIPPAAKDLMEALGTDANYFDDVVKQAQRLPRRPTMFSTRTTR